jgi:hypothetical protein
VRALGRRIVESRGDWSANLGRIERLFESLVARARAEGAG